MQALYNFVAGFLPNRAAAGDEEFYKTEACRTLDRLRNIQRNIAGPSSGPGEDASSNLPWEPVESSFGRAAHAAKESFRPLLVVLDSPLHSDSETWIR